jgi:hypothetical protein
MKPLIAGIVLSLALSVVPVPRISVNNPTLLYAAAMYKTAIGDTQSALRLMHRADQVQQPAVPEPAKTAQAACDRSTNL